MTQSFRSLAPRVFCALGIATALLIPAASHGENAPSDDIVLADFESAKFDGWTATGNAFASGPASGDQLGKLEIENARGKGVASSEIEGDAPMGTLTSAAFKIERRYLSFLVGGGGYEIHTCINLLIDGKTVRSATGWNSDRLVPVSWNIGEFQGRMAQVQIVDEASGGWGHINVDDIRQTGNPERLPVVTEPLYREAFRPQFHFTARQWTTDRLNPGMRQDGWLNDLNGLIYYEGEYHLFAQRWNKCWIHAVSRDLVHWTELEPAFWEEKLDSGVQSGTCVIDYANTSGLSPSKETPPMVAFWSRNDNASHCLSYSLDRGRTWKHYEKNPILVHPERDPKVFWFAPKKHWIMLVSAPANQYHILTSDNLLDWRDEKKIIGNSFECPDFFELPIDGDKSRKKWVLIRGDGKYSVGEFDGSGFKEETAQFSCDVGPHFYATQTWANTETGDGRRIQTAWMRGGSYPDMPFNQQITFPCELTLRSTPNGPRVFREPIREIETIQGKPNMWTKRTLNAGQRLPIEPSGALYRIQAEVNIPDGAKLTFNLRGIPVVLTAKTIESGSPAASVADRVRSVEILVDRTSIEAFVNRGEISTSRCILPKESGLSVKAEGGSVAIESLTVHPLKSIWSAKE